MGRIVEHRSKRRVVGHHESGQHERVVLDGRCEDPRIRCKHLDVNSSRRDLLVALPNPNDEGRWSLVGEGIERIRVEAKRDGVPDSGNGANLLEFANPWFRHRSSQTVELDRHLGIVNDLTRGRTDREPLNDRLAIVRAGIGENVGIQNIDLDVRHWCSFFSKCSP